MSSSTARSCELLLAAQCVMKDFWLLRALKGLIQENRDIRYWGSRIFEPSLFASNSMGISRSITPVGTTPEFFMVGVFHFDFRLRIYGLLAP